MFEDTACVYSFSNYEGDNSDLRVSTVWILLVSSVCVVLVLPCPNPLIDPSLSLRSSHKQTNHIRSAVKRQECPPAPLVSYLSISRPLYPPEWVIHHVVNHTICQPLASCHGWWALSRPHNGHRCAFPSNGDGLTLSAPDANGWIYTWSI